MFHPTLRTVSVLQKCMLNFQEYAVNDCRPRDREKENKSRTEEEKKKIATAASNREKHPHFFPNESGLSRENKPLPRTQRPLQRVICVHFQENKILINTQQRIAYNAKYNLLSVTRAHSRPNKDPWTISFSKRHGMSMFPNIKTVQSL